MSAAIIAFGAVSALGEGEDAVRAGDVDEPARVVITADEELRLAGLAHPFAARAALGPGTTDDRGTQLLRRAVEACARELDRVLPQWRRERIGLAMGTSSGGLRTAEALFDALGRGQAIRTPAAAGSLYFAPVHQAVSGLGLAFEPVTLVLGACAASTIALGLGMRWLDEGACDLVLAGGFDSVSVMVAAGFEVLRATTHQLPPRPFRAGRDGMALGEGAAVLALRSAGRAPDALGYVGGFGASCDAVHLTAPDRTGSGLARAARAALDEAGSPSIDLISAHATATPFNDAAEARAIQKVLGGDAARAVVHPFKAQIGHTLGAAGALETLAALDAMRRGLLPAAAGSGPMDPDAPANLLAIGAAGTPAVALKLSAAFGGANAAVVVSRTRRPSRALPRREAFMGPAVHIADEPDVGTLAKECGFPIERIARADLLTRYTLAAVARLTALHGSLSGGAIVVGEAFATLETGGLFRRRLVERGARMAEPRRFPYTSPNAPPGDASVAFGLTGPGFAVGGGLHAGVEALAVGTELVRAGDADRVLVIAVDDVGSVVQAILAKLGLPPPKAGAIGVLVSASDRGATARIKATALRLGDSAPEAAIAPGHLALLPLLTRPLPLRLEAGSPQVADIPTGTGAGSTGALRACELGTGAGSRGALLTRAYAWIELEPCGGGGG